MGTSHIIAAPHRAWFMLGLTSALLSVAWWLLFWLAALYAPSLSIAPPVAPAHIHGLLMSHGLLGFYIFGFLTTVFPRWQNQPPIERRRWLPGVVLSAVGYLMTLAGLVLGVGVLVAGVLLLALGHALASLSLLQVYLAAGERRVWHASASLLGLGSGLGALLIFAWGAATGQTVLTGGAAQASIWLYLLAIYAAVGHRMIPFFSSRVIDDYVMVRPWTPLALILLGGAGHLALELADLSQWRWAPDLVAALAAGWLALAWKPWRCVQPPLLATLHLGYAWLPLALLLSAGQSLGLLLTDQLLMPRAPLHALTIGFFGTLMVAMVTRVSLGHSGRPLVMGRTTQALVLGMQGVVLLRISAELPWVGSASWTVNLAAAGLWLLVVGLWAAIYGPMYWRPRADGRPG